MSPQQMNRITGVLLPCLLMMIQSHAGAAEGNTSSVPADRAVSTSRLDVIISNDLVYRTLVPAGKAEEELALDLVRPSRGKGPFPTIIILHGTSPFNKGRKQFQEMLKALALEGYVPVAVSYRFKDLPEPLSPFEDVQAAVRWLRTHATDYDIDPNRIGALGYSGGAGLASMLGMASPANGLDRGVSKDTPSCRMQAVVSYFAPSDLAELHASTVRRLAKGTVAQKLEAGLTKWQLEKWLRGSPKEQPDAYAKMSPITFVGKDAAPILLLHGSADDRVPVEQSELLAKALRAKRATVTLLIFDGAPHDFDELKNSNALLAASSCRAFFREHLKPIERIAIAEK